MSSDLGIGIDVGGTKCLGVLIDAGGDVLAESRVPTPEGAAELIDTIVAVAAELAGLAGGFTSVGVGVPGLVTAEGILRFAANLVGVSDLPVGDLLVERLGRSVVVDNDANCAVWAERAFGAMRGHDDGILITLGTGIGTGIVAGGRLWRGAHGFAGELGHLIVDPSGDECTCGRRGCWETMASGRGLAALARRAIAVGVGGNILSVAGGDLDTVRGEHVTRAAQQGDVEAKEIIDAYARWVALGIANGVAVLDPEILLIGGGLVAEHELLLDPIRGHLDELVFAAGHRPRVPVEPTALGERAGAIGAALLGLG